MRTFLHAVLIGLGIMGMTGCTGYSGTYVGRPGHLQGTWGYANTENGPLTLTFRRNHTFEVDGDGDGQKDIWGTYDLFENRITFKEEAPRHLTECTEWGFYHYYFAKGQLNFTVVADQCRPRRLVLEQAFVNRKQ